MRPLRALLPTICALLILALAIGATAPRAAAAELVFAYDDGRIVAADDADRLWAPASLTKLMTAYVVFEAIALGHLRWNQSLTVSRAAASQPAVALGLKLGETISVGDAVKAMLLRSSNDAAVVLAEAVSGTEERFAQRMTQTARRLGMFQSNFANASGLPHKDQVTTAREMGLLARALLRDLPSLTRVVAKTGFDYNGKWLGNINGVLNTLSGADGMKTGFTCKSGYNLIVSAQRANERVIAVILGERSSGARRSKAHRLIESGFKNLKDKSKVLGTLMPLLPEEGKRRSAVKPIPTVLSRSECAYGVARRNPNAGVGDRSGGSGRYRGPWGVQIGSFASKKQANFHLNSLRKDSSQLRVASRSVVNTKKPGNQKYRAAFTNLKEGEARDACRTLRQKGHFCVVLNSKGQATR